LRGSGQTIATVVAHREPWGVIKLLATKVLRLTKKITTKNFQRIGFLDFKFRELIYEFFKEKLMTFSNYFCKFLKVFYKNVKIFFS
jgi:hypothetical protein